MFVGVHAKYPVRKGTLPEQIRNAGTFLLLAALLIGLVFYYRYHMLPSVFTAMLMGFSVCPMYLAVMEFQPIMVPVDLDATFEPDKVILFYPGCHLLLDAPKVSERITIKYDNVEHIRLNRWKNELTMEMSYFTIEDRKLDETVSISPDGGEDFIRRTRAGETKLRIYFNENVPYDAFVSELIQHVSIRTHISGV